MGASLKISTLLLIIALTASSFLVVNYANGLTTPTVPDFTVQFTENRIEIRIKNQPFQNTDEYNNSVELQYFLSIERTSEPVWETLVNAKDDYTVFQFNWSSDSKGYKCLDFQTITLYPDSQVDFKLKAVLHADVEIPIWYDGPTSSFYQESAWSDTQTVTIPELVTTQQPIDYAPFVAPVVLVVVVVVLGACLVVYDLKKRKSF